MSKLNDIIEIAGPVAMIASVGFIMAGLIINIPAITTLGLIILGLAMASMIFFD